MGSSETACFECSFISLSDWATTLSLALLFLCINRAALGSDHSFSVFDRVLVSVLVGEAARAFRIFPLPDTNDTLGLTAYQRHRA